MNSLSFLFKTSILKYTRNYRVKFFCYCRKFENFNIHLFFFQNLK
ncbi:hypothetical protein SAMN02910274_02326 [Bacteroides sp. AR29]|nr:hypothetical protein SAMN02910274_02326 [Bacteroides sp. AR29]